MKWNKVSTSLFDGSFICIYELKEEENSYPTVFKATLEGLSETGPHPKDARERLALKLEKIVRDLRSE